MKALLAVSVVGLGLAGSIGLASAQPYGGRGYEYEERGPRYRDRGYDDGYGRRGGGGGGGGYAFDEREYLRCNPDVRRAVMSGQMRSGSAHYQEYGRRERRPLSC